MKTYWKEWQAPRSRERGLLYANVIIAPGATMTRQRLRAQLLTVALPKEVPALEDEAVRLRPDLFAEDEGKVLLLGVDE